MSEQWLQSYIQLAFRIDKAIRAFSAHSPFVDCYYGPPDWKDMVATEGVTSASDLLRMAGQLIDTLPLQQFESHRQTYLAKQMLAMETVCRKLCGEIFTLEDEVQRCFDIRPTWTPETVFEQAFALAETTLPGEGNLFERMDALEKHYELAREQVGLLEGFMHQVLTESRRRTQAFVSLPIGEEVEVQIVTDKAWLANNTYLGKYRSHIDVNTDLPTVLAYLPGLASHEGYPGHHVEAVLKEQSLYQAKGYLEQTIGLLISPQMVISEGIATLAPDMIFTPGEQQQWLAEHLYPAVGIEPLSVDWAKLHNVFELLHGVRGNAVFLLREGRSDREVTHYLQCYFMTTDEAALKMLTYLKRPFREAYVFTYFQGKQLMQPWLRGADRFSVFRRFLTEQLYPSELVLERT
ncbi:MAG: hypothetical protein ABI406_08765 [Ktedonobacteraceae bacterium]